MRNLQEWSDMVGWLWFWWFTWILFGCSVGLFGNISFTFGVCYNHNYVVGIYFKIQSPKKQISV